MGRRRLTQELYDRLVEGYRESPGNHAHAARIAGCGWKLAKRSWEDGWKEYTYAIPIKDQLQADKEGARLQRSRILEEERTKKSEEREEARKDAIQARSQEAQAAQRAGVNALAMANIIGKIVLACGPLSTRLAEMLKDPDNDMTARMMAQILKDSTYIVKRGNDAIRTALEIERLRVGNPIDTMDLGIEDMTHEEALEELEGLSKTLARARQQEIVVDDVPVDYPEDDEPPEETEDTELSTEELDNLIDRELEE